MNKKRYTVLDNIRGATLVSMMLYHGTWNLVYIFGKPWAWYRTTAAYCWQQSICWTFILLSGFCWSLGKRKWRRALEVFGAGILITAVTLIAMPQNRVVFGVLTCLGSCMLLLTLLQGFFEKIPWAAGLTGAFTMFVLTRNINRGYLGFGPWNLLKLPENLYKNWFSTYVGFPAATFFSTDYFSVFPWIFLFLAGYFLYKAVEQKQKLDCLCMGEIPLLSWLGKHSLPIYLLHQPIIYGVLLLVYAVS